MDSKIKAIEEAIIVIHSPLATSESRKAANDLCETVKSASASEIVNISLTLLSHQSSSSSEAGVLIVHYALHLLIFVVKDRWISLNEDERKSMISIAVQILTTPATMSENLLREKTSSFIVELATRTWPSTWPDFLHKLTEIANSSSIQKGTVLFILRDLPNQVCVFTDSAMSKDRKTQVIQALKSVHREIFLFSTKTIVERAESASVNAESKGLCLAALDLLEAYVSWIPVESLSIEFGIPKILIQLQRSEELKQKSADVLLAIILRSGIEEQFPLFPEFFNELLSAASISCQASNYQPGKIMSPKQQASYNHFVKIVEIIAYSGCTALNEATGKHKRLPDSIKPCFQAVLDLIKFPSEDILKEEFTDNLAVSLLGTIFTKISAEKTIIQEIQDNEEEEIKTKSSNLLRFISRSKSTTTIDLILKEASRIINQGFQGISNNQLHGFIKFSSFAIGVITINQLPEVQKALLVQIIQTILQLNLQKEQSIFVVKLLHVFSKLIFIAVPEALSAISAKVIMIYKEELQKGSIPIDKESKHIRYGCLRLLSALSRQANLMDKLNELGQIFINSKVPGVYFPALEQKLMAGLLLNICRTDKTKQLEVCSQLLSTVSSVWSAQDVIQSLSNLESFANSLFNNSSTVSSIVSCIDITETCLSKVKNIPIFQVFPPNLLISLIQIINQIHSPSFRAALPSELRTKVEYLFKKDAVDNNSTKSAVVMLLNAKCYIYAILGFILDGGNVLIQFPGFDDAIRSALLFKLEERDEQILQFFVNNIISHLTNVSSPEVLPKVYPLLKDIMAQLNSVFEHHWTISSSLSNTEMEEEEEENEQENEQEEEEGDENKEISKDTKLRMATRAYLKWIRKTIENGFLEQNTEIVLLALSFCCKAILFKDSDSQRSSISLCSKMIPKILNQQITIIFEVLDSVLGLITSPPNHSNNSSVGITDNIWPVSEICDLMQVIVNSLNAEQSANFISHVLNVAIIKPEIAKEYWNSMKMAQEIKVKRGLTEKFIRTISESVTTIKSIGALPIAKSAQTLSNVMQSTIEHLSEGELSRLFADKQ